MIRLTNYGLWVKDDGNLDQNEIAINYILDCARSVGIEIEYGKTILDIQFIAEVMKKLRGDINDQSRRKESELGVFNNIPRAEDIYDARARMR